MIEFSDAARKSLLASKYVEKISGSHVSFTAEFKIKAVEMNLKGKTPPEIFLSLGIDPLFFLPNYPKKTISRWKKIYLEEGKSGLEEEKRGKGATGRPKRTVDLNDLESLRARLAYVEAENDFLKKLHALADLKEKKNTRS